MRKTIKALEAKIASLSAEKDSHAANWLKHRDRADLAERARDQIAKDNADLKERLHNAEVEVARLNGYMQRVREDDAVNDPLVEVEGPDGKRMVSKRHPTPNGPYAPEIFNSVHDYLSSNPRKHWTSY